MYKKMCIISAYVQTVKQFQYYDNQGKSIQGHMKSIEFNDYSINPLKYYVKVK